MILALVLLDMKLVSIGLTKPALSTCVIVWVLLLIGVSATAANIGDLAPDFQVTTQNGSTFQLSDFRGQKPVYVVFWNSWCSYCIKKTPRYQKLQEQFGDKIEIIAINTTWSDTPEEMRSFVRTITESAQSPVPFASAVNSTRATLAILESLESGAPIDVTPYQHS